MRVSTSDGTGGDLTHVDFASKKCKVELGDGDVKEFHGAKLTPAGTWSSTDVAWQITKLLEFDAAADEYKVEWLATMTPRPVVDEFKDKGLSSRREKPFVVGTQQMVVVGWHPSSEPAGGISKAALATFRPPPLTAPAAKRQRHRPPQRQ